MAYSEPTNLIWRRTPIDPALLSKLMQRSNFRGGLQTFLHLGWFATTACFTYWIYLNISAQNWPWMTLFLLASLFVHGTMGPFMGLIAVHELQHKSVFKTRALNTLFEFIYAFLSWSDCIWYRYSHAQHHRATCHPAHDGEVVLPLKFNFKPRFWLAALAWDPRLTWLRLARTWQHARGQVDDPWSQYVLASTQARREHKHWARVLLVGHALLATLFIVSGNWFLVILITFGTQYCNWLGFLCGVAQHYGLQANSADFRTNSRTFTCSRVVGFYYWNMQYHLEHHMYPAVPFYNLPKLHRILRADLPPTPHGLINTWKEILSLRKEALAELRSA